MKIVLSDSCDFNQFYRMAELIRELGGQFGNLVDDFDTLYWPLSFRGFGHLLYFNIYSGVELLDWPPSQDHVGPGLLQLAEIIVGYPLPGQG
jgi:hypothetical protein